MNTCTPSLYNIEIVSTLRALQYTYIEKNMQREIVNDASDFTTKHPFIAR